ncbi:MAG TPA: GyrI-like domain-containing protein [Gemmatimonadaceae bacterium]
MQVTIMNATAVSHLAPPRLETLRPLEVAGLVQRYDSQSPSGIPDQWQRFTPYIGHILGQLGEVTYGVSYNFDKESNFDYMCGVEVKETRNLPKGFKSLLLPAQKYAVFTHAGHVAGIRATYTAIWSKWLPAAGCRAVDGPTFERYDSKYNPLTGRGGFEIWIPIQR